MNFGFGIWMAFSVVLEASPAALKSFKKAFKKFIISQNNWDLDSSGSPFRKSLDPDSRKPDVQNLN